MTNVILRGFYDLEGETLGVFLAGLDCGDFPVIGGRITIPLDGTVASGLLTERWLTQVTVMGRDWGLNTVILDGGNWRVPCVVGYRYKSRGQLLRPVTPQDTGARTGPGFGKYSQISQFAALVNSAGPTLKFGTSFDPKRMHPILARTAGERGYTPTELFSGIIWDTLDDEKLPDGSMFAWEVTGPYSAQICAAGAIRITTEDK